MPSWKQILLGGYYYGTLPMRAWLAHRAEVEGRAPAIVVMYHRVADDGASSWTVPFDRFRRQIAWLRDRCDLVSLEESQQRLRDRHNFRTCVSITFDDGYAVNSERALPWLIQQQVPCTYFVAWQNIVEQIPFGHDVAMGNSFAPNTVQQLRELAAAGIEIGAHSRTHPDFGTLTDPEQLRDELVVARDELQSAVDCPVRYFAFPFGQPVNLSRAAFALARESGYLGVCSAYGGYNFPGDDPFHLQRFGGECSLLSMKNWARVDPRKRGIVRFERHWSATTMAAGATSA